jgi:uncharacterized protein YqgQ
MTKQTKHAFDEWITAVNSELGRLLPNHLLQMRDYCAKGEALRKALRREPEEPEPKNREG